VSNENLRSIADLLPRQKLEGKVKKVTLSGAIVDVGAEVDGLLHISDLGEVRVTRVSNVLNEGDAVTVWVKKVDQGNGRLSLTLVEPLRFTWPDLQSGLKAEGKVVRLEKFGAFVDIGAETDGLVHISEMARGRVNKPSDVVAEGDVVSVWIKDADRKSKRISLTMMEPPERDIHSLKADDLLTGKVVRLENFGAFVDIGAGRDGMIHVTEMGHGYVGSPSEILSVGDQVQVRVLEVDARRGRISLSMKDLPRVEYRAEEEEVEEAPSAMELALRQAMQMQGVDLPLGKSRRAKQKTRRRHERMQDDIVSRTLRSHKD